MTTSGTVHEISVASGTRRRTRLHVGLWVAQGLLAAAFGVAGLTHATRPIAEMAKMAPWTGALPEGLVRFIGVVELAGALGLVLPALTRIRPALTAWAATGLATVMALAMRRSHRARRAAGAAGEPRAGRDGGVHRVGPRYEGEANMNTRRTRATPDADRLPAPRRGAVAVDGHALHGHGRGEARADRLPGGAGRAAAAPAARDGGRVGALGGAGPDGDDEPAAPDPLRLLQLPARDVPDPVARAGRAAAGGARARAGRSGRLRDGGGRRARVRPRHVRAAEADVPGRRHADDPAVAGGGAGSGAAPGAGAGAGAAARRGRPAGRQRHELPQHARLRRRRAARGAGGAVGAVR